MSQNLAQVGTGHWVNYGRQRKRQKAVGLYWQNNNFARASRSFVQFFFFVRYDVKMPNFTFCGEREPKTTTLFFLFLNFDTVV